MRALADAIRVIEQAVADPAAGLPEDVFLLLARLTPLINVDLLIQNSEGETLLTWRDDALHEQGWHVPGGVIRYRELARQRIDNVAKQELGAEVGGEALLTVEEIILPHARERAHSVSLLYRIDLASGPDPALAWREGAPSRGQWAWFASCPDNILAVHRRYAAYFQA